MRELELIELLRAEFGAGSPRLVRSIGDDAAVVRAGRYAVTSLDTVVEGVHFRTGQLTWNEIGHRALAAAISDLAAMGTGASEAYLALGLPEGVASESVSELVAGVGALARRLEVALAGGDIVRASALTLSFTVVGWVQDAGSVVGRDGARPGDGVYVTGALGGAGAGRATIEGRAGSALDGELQRSLRARFARPLPRLEEGRRLAAAGARAMLDLSDGLAADAARLAEASGVRLELELARLPLEAGVEEVARELGEDPRVFAATAGEDFELCACLPDAGTPAPPILTRIGEVVAGIPAVVFVDHEAPLAGYEHRF